MQPCLARILAQPLGHLGHACTDGDSVYLQVLVRQVSTSVNPVDYKMRAGSIKKLPKVLQDLDTSVVLSSVRYCPVENKKSCSLGAPL